MKPAEVALIVDRKSFQEISLWEEGEVMTIIVNVFSFILHFNLTLNTASLKSPDNLPPTKASTITKHLLTTV